MNPCADSNGVWVTSYIFRRGGRVLDLRCVGCRRVDLCLLLVRANEGSEKGAASRTGGGRKVVIGVGSEKRIRRWNV